MDSPGMPSGSRVVATRRSSLLARNTRLANSAVSAMTCSHPSSSKSEGVVDAARTTASSACGADDGCEPMARAAAIATAPASTDSIET